MRVCVKKLTPNALIPTKGYPGDAGWDLSISCDLWLPAHGKANVPTGVAIALPSNVWAHILPRSSTYTRHELLVIPAVIDSGWRGELSLQIHNLADRPTSLLRAGTRLAQMILHEIPIASMVEVDHLPPGERGERGFGSTGM